MQQALDRCTNVGYPGRFRQPESFAYFRFSASVEEQTKIRWASPLGRGRLFINGQGGDVTGRAATVPKGKVDLLFEIDFALGLPCLLLEGGPLTTGPHWEASLDRVHWVQAEYEPASHSPTIPPDQEPELTVLIPPSTPPTGSFELKDGQSLTVDFRHDELGRLALDASGVGSLMVSVGETALEAENTDTRTFEQKPLPEIALAPKPRGILLPERCVRFARFTARGGAVSVQNLRLEARVSPVEYKGSFTCSDATLTDLWNAGAATIHANLHHFYLDGIKRDALCWWDALISLEAGDAVFFDGPAARHTLLSMTLPPNPEPGDMGIIDTPLYVVTAFESDWLARGDLAFSLRYRDRLEGILEFFTTLQDKDGFVDARNVQPYGYFPDWSATVDSGPDAHGAPAYGQMHLMRAFEIGAAFEERWGDQTKRQKYRAQAERLRASIQRVFWDPARKVYVNGIDSQGKLDTGVTRYAQSFAILFGLAPENEWGHLISAVLNNPQYKPKNWSVGQQWEFLAYARAHDIAPVLERLKSDWGAQRRMGYSRLVEDVRPGASAVAQMAMYGRPYAHSMCHVWSGAAVIFAAARGVLGVWPTGPGFTRCRIAPQAPGLSFARGSVPTPRGPISVSIEGQRAQIKLPPGTTANLPDGSSRKGPTELEISLS